MEEKIILNVLEQIFQEVFNNQELRIDINTSSDTVEGWDSLTQTKVISEIEDKFGIKLSMRDVLKCKKNVLSLKNVIESLVK